MDFRTIHQDLIVLIQEDVSLIAADNPVSEISDSYEHLSRAFQALAICHLLENLDLDQFRENLVRSAYARKSFLTKMANSAQKNRYLSLSRTEAYLDAIVAGKLDVATDIATLSPDEWVKDWEYEEDYCFYLFLQNLIDAQLLGDHKSLSAILMNFEKSLEGGTDNRMQVCQALLSTDEEAFHSSLCDYLEEVEEKVDQQRGRMLEPDIETLFYWPRSFISIEGLALIQFARIRGMDVQGSFPLCPDIARLATTDSVYPDFFQGIELALQKR